MMDTTTREWRDVPPEDITSEPGWDTGWELVHVNVVKVTVRDKSQMNMEHSMTT